jgi:osmotically-inducible protein OsmY
MIKRLIPALFLASVVGCGDNNNTKADRAEELQSEASKANTEAARADAVAEEKNNVADEKNKEATVATQDAWREYARESWNPDWDKFYGSKDAKWEGPNYSYERSPDGITVTRKDNMDDHSRVEDAMVAAAVNSQYVTDKDVKAHHIDVEVIDNVVHLRGTVGSAAEASEAVRLAVNTRGVHRVVSHLSVAP